MSNKVYRTAKGAKLDLGALLLQNENTRAVGNMNVNAKGDKINTAGKSIESRNTQVSKSYQKQTKGGVVDSPVVSRVTKKMPVASAPVVDTQELEAPPVVKKTVTQEPAVKQTVVEEPVVEEPAPKATTTAKKTSGLADAIAKAKSVQQEKEKTPRQQAKAKKGVNKL